MAKRKKRRALLYIIGAILFISIVNDLSQEIAKGNLQAPVTLLTLCAIVGFVWYRSRDSYQRMKEEYKRKFEADQEKISVKDAALYSLTFSREIFKSIPPDRRRLVRNAFVLLAIAGGLLAWKNGLDSLGVLLIAAILVFAAVNILISVVATERSSRQELQYQLDLARQMQISLMPSQAPTLPGLDIAGCCQPARNVGGDHFDYVALGGDASHLGIAVADVAGKGLDAAMTAVFTSGAFNSEVLHDGDIASIMTRLNTAVRSRRNPSRFVCFLLASFHLESQRFRFVNAGQVKPLLLRNGTTYALEQEGIRFPLGIADKVIYRSSEFDFLPGDVMLLFTDGITEAMNANMDVFGDEKLKQVLSGIGAKEGAKVILERVHSAVSAFNDAAEPHDDLTLVVVKRKPLGMEASV